MQADPFLVDFAVTIWPATLTTPSDGESDDPFTSAVDNATNAESNRVSVDLYPDPISVEITSPAEAERIPIGLQVKGTSSNIPRDIRGDRKLWVVVFVPETGRYYPQGQYGRQCDVGPIQPEPNGTWTSHKIAAGIPSDTGKPFEIIAVLVSLPEQELFCQYLSIGERTDDFPGFGHLWGTEYDRVHVVRGPGPPDGPGPDRPPTPDVTITAPPSHSQIRKSVTPRGTSQRMQPTQQIWLVLEHGDLFYPQGGPVTPDENGDWVGPKVRPKTKGAWKLHAVVPNDSGRRKLDLPRSLCKDGALPRTP